MPEWGFLPLPKKLLAQGVRDMVRVSDARMSGTAFGTVVVHVAPESAVGGPRPRHEVDRWESPRDLGDGRLAIGQVWFDLPLDGEWSDLTATFEIQRAVGGVQLVLNDIHVF